MDTGIPGTTSNGMPCSCRNSASLPPLSKTKGSPHFNRTTVFPSRDFSASRKQMASCSSRLGCRRADIDPLGVGTGAAQEPRMHAMVVDHHIGRFEITLASHADERRIARASSDEIDARLFHDVAPLRTGARTPLRLRLRAPRQPRPKRCRSPAGPLIARRTASSPSAAHDRGAARSRPVRAPRWRRAAADSRLRGPSRRHVRRRATRRPRRP